MSALRSVLFCLSAALGLSAAFVTSAATLPPVRIMPLGDSITAGYNVPDGYRAPLYASLTSLGYSVDFVGTQADNNSGSIPDPNHEGHSGWRISGIDASISGFLDSVADPDVILLHLGTNDANDLGTFSSAIDRLDALITKIAIKRPYAHIIVTSLLPRTETAINAAIETQFNPSVPAKVAAQAALGRRVTFLDMHAYLTTDDLADTAHPNQTGYNKMAAAWLPAITNVIAPTGVRAAPAIIDARSLADNQQVAVTFSKPVDPATATDTGNYTLSGGLDVTGATLDAAQRTVTLSTGQMAADTTYTLTVNDVTDLSTPTPLAIADNSTVALSGTTPRGYLNNVAESAGYTLVYSLDLPNSANYSAGPVPYAVDNHLAVASFSRVAYYMELQKADGDLTYMWASMDAFTNDTAALGVPTLASGAIFQKTVANLTVESNDPTLTTGTGLSGNIEFWPYNYLYANSGTVPGGDNGICDFDDTMDGGGNYSCMQLHNYSAKQTLFAYNNWNGAGANSDVGIGNCPAPVLNGVDWTFAHNAADYTVKTLQVLVLRDSDTTAPTLVSAQSFARGHVAVRFSEPLAPSSVSGACFALNNGVQVLSATLDANQRDVTLITTRQPAGSLTLTVNGIRDSGAGNPIAPNSSIAVTAGLPAEIAANIGALATGYQLVCTIDIPVAGYFDSSSSAYSFDQRSAGGAFDRVAYYLELQKTDGTVQYIWTSMDAFTADAAKLGIPVGGTFFQQTVNNLDVLSNVGGIVNGTGITTGNIEFWPSNFGMGNGLPIPGASDDSFDFGDSGGSAAGSGHGCMQVHNYGAGQTLFGINHFNGGNPIGLGIGNNPPPYAIVPDPDWTATYNAGTYLRRKLHVLVRPTTFALPAEVTANVPASDGYQLACTINIPVNGNFNTSSADYSNDNRASIGPFTRVAYYLELKKPGDPTASFIWTAMDAFTTDAMKLGVPVIGTIFQQKVTRLDVLSNVSGIVNGTGFSTGNIEFWPSNYEFPNGLNLPNANPGATDFDDYNASSTYAGWGSMQVHNYGALQTLFAVNNFNNNNVIGMGIGNNPNPGSYPGWPFNDPDWSFSFNADTFERRVLHVMVLPGSASGADTTAPALVGAVPSTARNSVVVSFSETLADTAAAIANFSINNGVTVTGATLLSDKKSVCLTTYALAPEQTYQLSVAGVRDRSSSGNLIAAGSSLAFTASTASLPPAISGHVAEAADYEMIYQLAIPNLGNFVPYGAPYALDQSLFPQARTQPFDRVAYCLELVTGGVTQWAYVSMDAFTGDLSKIGVPTSARGAVFQQYVNNMNVYASDNAAVTTGTAIATGNIEFWASGFSADNNMNVPNALGGQVFDFGDSGGSTDPTYGSMQIHNHGDATIAGHTVMSLSRFMQGNELALGIGNNTDFTFGGGYEDPDWTLHPNASIYTVKNLYVLARWGGATQGTKPTLLSQPADRSIKVGESTRLMVEAAGATYYQWRRNGVAIGGANQAWLEIAPAALTDSGTYDVLVYGSGTASTSSRAVTLHVTARGTLMKLR